MFVWTAFSGSCACQRQLAEQHFCWQGRARLVSAFQGTQPTNCRTSRARIRTIVSSISGASPSQEPRRAGSENECTASGDSSASDSEDQRLDELFHELMRQDLERRYGSAVASQWGTLPPDENINPDNPRFRQFIEQLVENERTMFAEDPAIGEPDWEHDQEIAAFLAEHAEKLGLDGPPKAPADLLPPRSTLREALQHYRQSLGQAPGRDPTFRRAAWPPQVLSFEAPRKAHAFWYGWCCRYDVEQGKLQDKQLLENLPSEALLPDDSTLVPVELPSSDSAERRDPRHDWCMPFGTAVFPDGSYTGGVPAVHSETAAGRDQVPQPHTPFELSFGCVITSSMAARCGCQPGLLDVAVEYQDRQATSLRVRWLMPGHSAVSGLTEETLSLKDPFSARMLSETISSAPPMDRHSLDVLSKVRFPSEEPAFCIFPLYPQMPCCWHASQVALEALASTPLAAEKLSRYEVDLDRTEFDDPDIIGTQVRLLRIPRTVQMKTRKSRLGHTMRVLLAREAARVAPCTHLLRRSIARYETLDGLYNDKEARVWVVPNVEETFVARRLVHLPGGLVCLFPERIPRVGFGWDAEFWFWGPAFETRLEEAGEEMLVLPSVSFRRMIRSYSALGDFVAGCATQGIEKEPSLMDSSSGT